jgi:hypothetical protein
LLNAYFVKGLVPEFDLKKSFVASSWHPEQSFIDWLVFAIVRNPPLLSFEIEITLFDVLLSLVQEKNFFTFFSII